MSGTPVDTAHAWLHRQLDLWEELPDRARNPATALAGVDALVAAGALTHDDAVIWRRRLVDDRDADPQPSRATCFAASGLLQELFDASAGDPDGDERGRFDGALELCNAIGAVDARAWRERQRLRDGVPSEDEEAAIARELNRDGTNVELRSIHTGPNASADGYRLVQLLCFADGVEATIEQPRDDFDEGWDPWSLTDDVGTAYRPGGGGGNETTQTWSFAGGPPPEASWLELTMERRPHIHFRVTL
jgi:hypothetical protein